MIGLRTRMITAIRITDSFGTDVADTKNFLNLIKDTQEHFTVKRVCADRAYWSVGNLIGAENLGVTPYIYPKANQPLADNPRAHKYYKFFYEQQEAFFRFYRFRQHVEGVFSTLKRILDGYTWATGEQQRRNEIMVKVIIHNLRQLIRLEILHDEPVDFYRGTILAPRKHERAM